MAGADRGTTMTSEADAETGGRRSWLVALPVVLFLGLAGLFGIALFSGDPSKIPSALIGKPAPTTALAPIPGLTENGAPVPGFDGAALNDGSVTIVNFWASWCGPCVDEHPHLITLARETGLPIYGVNYKDTTTNAQAFLARLGNPYRAVGRDPNGAASIDWGVYGMPETFIVDGQGRIAHKHIGPITETALKAQILPAIERARAASQ